MQDQLLLSILVKTSSVFLIDCTIHYTGAPLVAWADYSKLWMKIKTVLHTTLCTRKHVPAQSGQLIGWVNTEGQVTVSGSPSPPSEVQLGIH